MEVKQEPEEFHEKSVKIKQEPEFVDLQTTVKVESHDWDIENSQKPPTPHLPKVKEEPHAEDMDDIREVKASDYFVSNSDLVNIKRELPELIESKPELLTTQCDLPSLKSANDYFNEPCSSKQAQETLQRTKQKKSAIKGVIKKKKKKKKFPCPICKKSYSASKLRINHLNGHFLNSYTSCNLCGVSFRKLEEYLSHSFVHFVKNKKSPNNNCTKSFSQSSKVSKTIVYKREKLYTCSICSIFFTQNSRLKCHMLDHIKEKVYESKICSMSFKLNKLLKRDKTIQIDDNPFKCEICLKCFKLKLDLKAHKRTHKGEKPFKCKDCSKSFELKNSLKVHERIHTDEKPFKCENCSKSFKWRYSLKVHKRIHSEETPFECEICSESFKWEYTLKTHKKIHTSGICSKEEVVDIEYNKIDVKDEPIQ